MELKEERELKYLRQVLAEYEFTFQEILQLLEWSQKKRKMYKQLLNAWEESGEIYLKRNGKYTLPEKEGFVKGEISISSGNFGFLDINGQASVFIPGAYLNTAMNGDTVLVRILKESSDNKKREGEVYKVIKRNRDVIVGVFEHNLSFGFVRPRNSPKDIYIPKKLIKGAKTGDLVAVKVDFWGDDERKPEGGIVSILGSPKDTEALISSLLLNEGIEEKFPNEVLQELDKIDEDFSDELENRKDLRHLDIITIDGSDAKDLDDAVYVEKTEDGYKLFVSIADVSYYVTENSEMDKEAFERGTSVYLTDRVVPMLPQRLSNGICSLHPYEERLTLTARMEIDRSGTIYQHEIFPSVIQSNERLTYDEVNVLFNTNEASEKITPEIAEMLWNMKELHTILERRRMERGAIDFDTQEAKILVDEKGAPTEIVLRERGVAERLIESFMLSANETVARHYEQKKVPFIYRIHENPDSEKLQRFLEFITAFGITIKGKNDSITPKKLQKALNEVRGEPYEAVVSTMMLRSMKQAKYDITPTGHYGLAAEDYTHFTSPIRRYPDLIVHRMIRHYGKHPSHLSKKEEMLLEDKLQQIADQSSRMERLAVQAERDVNALKKAEYMQDKVGEEFDGIVSSVTKFGMFVELANTVEGLIHISHLKQDYFNFIESHMILLGERTGVSYRIGDRVRVKCVKVDVEAREVDFLLVEDAKLAKTERPRKGERFDDKSSKKRKKSNGRQRFKKAIKTKKKRR